MVTIMKIYRNHSYYDTLLIVEYYLIYMASSHGFCGFLANFIGSSFQNGLYSAMPYVGYLVMCLLASWLVDYLRSKGIRTVIARKCVQATGK